MSRDSFWAQIARKLEQPVRPEVDQQLFQKLDRELRGRDTVRLSVFWKRFGFVSLAMVALLVLFQNRETTRVEPPVAVTSPAVDLDVELLESLDWLETLQDDEIQILAELSEEEFEQLINPY